MSNFYNPETNVIMSLRDLCIKYNTSISSSTEMFDNFYKLSYDSLPEPDEFQEVKEVFPPVFIDDKWVVQYELIDRDVEECRKEMLLKLNTLFDKKKEDAFIQSSLGFPIDANTTANTNVEGLIKVMENQDIESQYFCDYNNEYHLVTVADLKIMQIEIIINAQALYAKKWEYRDSIYKATTTEELRNINIMFN